VALARLAVLASGTGTILEAIIARGIAVSLVVADRPCRALEVAVATQVPSRLVDRREFGGFGAGFDRTRYSLALAAELTGVDLVAMAGFGTVVTGEFHDSFAGWVLNTHPSLLPAFPGWHAVADALAAGVAVTGCTVHIATRALDDGPILAQCEVEVRPGDTEDTLHERIKAVERDLYPHVIDRALVAISDGRPIDQAGL
jgi:phosphoribosylglycinamide formyltransferase-1